MHLLCRSAGMEWLLQMCEKVVLTGVQQCDGCCCRCLIGQICLCFAGGRSSAEAAANDEAADGGSQPTVKVSRPSSAGSSGLVRDQSDAVTQLQV